MRDDIHRKLPLPKAWKRFVRSCARDAERSSWPDRARHAAASELNRLSPALLDAAKRDAMQPDFFSGLNPSMAALARTPIDDAFMRSLAVAPQADRDAAVNAALGCALESILEAQLREARVHVALDAPKDCPQLLARMGASIRAADVPRLIAERIAGKPVAKHHPQPLDLDEDLRGKR